VYLCEIDDAFGAGSEIADFVGVILPDKYVFYFDVLVVDADLVDVPQSFQDGVGDLEELLLGEAFVLAGFKEVEEGAVGAVLHEYDHDFDVGVAVAEGEEFSAVAGNEVFVLGECGLGKGGGTMSSS
jgi:hypothetical protein